MPSQIDRAVPFSLSIRTNLTVAAIEYLHAEYGFWAVDVGLHELGDRFRA